MLSKNIFIYGSLIIVGFLCGYFSTQWYFFEIDYKISIVEVVSLIVTAGLGLYIAGIIQHRQSYSRVEKSLLIDELKKIRSDLDIIYSSVNRNVIPLDDTVFKFKLISGNVSTFGDLLNICNSSVKIDINEFHLKINTLKKIVTSVPFRNGCFILNQFEIGNFLNEFRKIIQHIYSLEIKINRLK